MNNTVKISIIIPFYNVDAALFQRCINSCLENDFNDFEIIVIDDGSEPSYIEKIAQMIKNDPRIKLISQTNRGTSGARNRGVQEAKGEYITFVDPDDFIDNTFLQDAWNIVCSMQSDLAIGYVATFMSEQDIKDLVIPEEIINDYSLNAIRQLRPKMICLDDYTHHNQGYLSRGPVARLLKTSIARDIPFVEGISIGEDVIWNLDILERCNKVSITNRIWYYYYTNPLSATHRIVPNIIEEYEKHFKELQLRVDFRKDQEYLAYIRKVKEAMTAIRENWANYKNGTPGTSHNRTIYQHIYKNDPWKHVGDLRFFKLGNMKEKIYCILFRSHCLFWLKDLTKQ